MAQSNNLHDGDPADSPPAQPSAGGRGWPAPLPQSLSGQVKTVYNER